MYQAPPYESWAKISVKMLNFLGPKMKAYDPTIKGDRFHEECVERCFQLDGAIRFNHVATARPRVISVRFAVGFLFDSLLLLASVAVLLAASSTSGDGIGDRWNVAVSLILIAMLLGTLLAFAWVVLALRLSSDNWIEAKSAKIRKNARREEPTRK